VGLSGPFIFRLAAATPLPRPPAAVSLTHHTSLITALLITPHSSQHYSSHLNHHSTTHHTSLITPHSSQHYSSHHLSITPRCRVAAAIHRASWRSCCARGRRWAAAAFRVAGAVHGAVWTSCCTRGRRLARVARGWLSCGRRIMQSLLEELLRAWSPAGPHGPRVDFVWQARYTESGGVAARVVAGWPAVGVRMAGAVHRACWRSCCARGRRLARGWRSCGRRSIQSLLEELLRARSPAGQLIM